jgi:hypothetical protein
MSLENDVFLIEEGKSPSGLKDVFINPFREALFGSLRRTIPKQRVVWHCPPPDSDAEPYVFVCNHDHAYGPIAMCTSFPRRFRTWVDGDMYKLKTARRHLEKTLIRSKTWLARLASLVISYFMVLPAMEALREMKAIPAYRDKRTIDTIRISIDSLMNGDNNLIFPEQQEPPYAPDVGEFQLGFIHIARDYFKKCAKRLVFYPVCLDRQSGDIHVGTPIRFDPDDSFPNQKREIGNYLRGEIINMIRQVR